MAKPTVDIARHTLAYGLGFLVGGLARLLLMPIIARTLSAEEFGILALLLAFVAFLQITFGLGLVETLIRFHHDQPTPEERRRLRVLVFVLMPAVDLLLALPLWLAREPIAAALLGTAEHGYLVGLAILIAFFSTQLNLYCGHLRAEDRSGEFILVMALRGIAALATTAIMVFAFGLGVVGFLSGQLVAPAVVLALTLPRLFAGLGLDLADAARRLRPIAAYGLPLVPAALGMWALTYLDSFLLAAVGSVDEVGVYRFAAEVSLPVSLLLTSFLLAWPSFAFGRATLPGGPESLARVFRHAFIVLVWVSLALAALRHEILTVLGADAFMESAKILPLWLLTICLYAAAQVFAAGLHVASRTRRLPLYVVVAIACDVGLALLLIPPAGAVGCAVAKALALTLLAGLTLRESNRHFRIPFDLTRLAVILAAATGVLIVTDAYGELPLLEGIFARGGTVLLFPLLLAMLNVVSPKELRSIRELLQK